MTSQIALRMNEGMNKLARQKLLTVSVAASALWIFSLGVRAGDPQELDISWFSIDGGGGQSSCGRFTLTGTIGQPDAGMVSGGDLALTGGFWAKPEDPEPDDCNENGIPDAIDIADETSADCNVDDIPDECTLADARSEDCNNDGIPDDCQIMRHYTALAEAPSSRADWSETNNWCDFAPVDTDHACIRSDLLTSNVTFAEDHRILSSLSCEIDYTIDGSASPTKDLELDGPSFITGNLTMTGNATLRNHDNLQVGGMLNWADRTIRGPGTTTVAGGMTLTPPDNRTTLSNGHHLLLTGGSATVNSKYISLLDTAKFTIGTGVTYTYNGSSNIFTGGLNTVIEVAGSLVRASGNGIATISSGVVTTSLVRNQTGELHIRQGGTHSGDVLSDPGTTLLLRGTHEFLPSSNLTAERLILEQTSSSNTAYVRGTVDIASSLECVGSKWVFASEANIVDYSPVVSVVTGNLTLEAPTDRSVDFDSVTIGPSPPSQPSSSLILETGQPVNASALGFYNGSVRGNSPINIAEEFIWHNGNFFSGGDITADGSIEIRSTNNSRSTQRVLNIAGSATMLAGLGLSSGTRLEVFTTGVFDLIGDTSITGSGAIHNAGTILKSTANEESTFTADIYNTGTVEIQIGSFHFQQMDYVQTGGQTILNGGHITSHLFGPLRIEGGVLAGVGSADCDISIDGGTAAPGLSIGELIIGQNYVQTSSGTLEIEISGTNHGEFDVLSVSDTATLAGDIEIALINGFVPAVGSTFQIITAATVNSEFDSVILTGVPPNLGIHAIYAEDSVTLEVVDSALGGCDDNGDIDLIDAACFADCVVGPVQPVTPGCEPFDFDSNERVDLVDYGYFAVAFGND